MTSIGSYLITVEYSKLLNKLNIINSIDKLKIILLTHREVDNEHA